VEQGVYTYETVDSPCGASVHGDDALPIATVDRYGLPISTMLSKKSGIMWESRRLTPESLERFYNEDYRDIYTAAARETFFLGQVHYGIELYQWLAHSCGATAAAPETVYDIGCGMGGVLEAFRLAGARHMAGVDYGEEFLREGRRRGLDLIHGSWQQLADRPPADLVIVSHVLEHISEVTSFLSGLRTVLKKDGLLLVVVPGIFNLKTYAFDLRNYLQNAHLYHFCQDTLAALASRCGYEVVAATEDVYMALRPADAVAPIPWDSDLHTKILTYFNRCEDIVTHPDALYPIEYEQGRYSKIRLLNRLLDKANLRVVHFSDQQRAELSKLLRPFIL